MGGWRTPR